MAMSYMAPNTGSRASIFLLFASAYRVSDGQGNGSYSISRDSMYAKGAARAGTVAATAEAIRILVYWTMMKCQA